MPLKIITCLNDVELSPLNHGEAYTVVKSASSYEDCFAGAITYGADIIMQISHPVFKIQDLFSTFENYQNLPMMLGFYVLSGNTVVYACSGSGKRRENFIALFIKLFAGKYTHFLDYSRQREQIIASARDKMLFRTQQLEKNEYLTDIMRGVTRQEFTQYKRKFGLDLKENGYYLYSWFIRHTKEVDYAHHKELKNLFNLIGDLLLREGKAVLQKYNGGEIFYENIRVICAFINAPENSREEGSESPAVKRIADELTYVLGTSEASRYMSGYFKSMEGARNAYESIVNLRQYRFFCRDEPLITDKLIESLKRTPKFENINQILGRIQHLIIYETGSSEIKVLVHKLLLDIVKPSMDHRLFCYCFANICSFISQKITDRFQNPASVKIPAPIYDRDLSIEVACANLQSAISYMQSDAKAGIAEVKNVLINKALKYIQKNYASDISLITLSGYLNISNVYLSQLFKKELGISPIKFIINYRIDRAKELLAETDDAIYNIAEKVGFYEPKHFSKTFKRITGMTPMQYRKNR